MMMIFPILFNLLGLLFFLAGFSVFGTSIGKALLCLVVGGVFIFMGREWQKKYLLKKQARLEQKEQEKQQKKQQ
ncbi:MAG: hypothetical protein RR387_06455 [Clostridiales bacterium]